MVFIFTAFYSVKGSVGLNNLISVIVPIYNVEAYIEKCLNSILAQTHRELEIILVDDGSPDNCGQICDDYAKKDPRIRVIHKPNGGLSDARNAGLDIATGDYIGFVDSDDWIEPDMFAYLLDGLQKANAQISICNVINREDHRCIIKNLNYKEYSGDEALKILLSDRMENYAWNKLYHRSLWDDLRYPKGKNFEDVLTIYKTFMRADRIVQLPDAKYYYRIRSDSISGSRDFANRIQIYTAFCDRYREAAPLLPQFRDSLFYRIRRYFCHEVSLRILHDNENRELNMELLAVLSSFVRENRDSLYSACHFTRLEKKKFDAFARGTVGGCWWSYFYHRLLALRHCPPYNNN